MSLIQKSENVGGRFDGSSKILGGIQFTGNTTQTTINAANTWYRIGNGALGHTLFTSIQSASVFPYWTLSGATVDTQIYTIGKCKADTMLTAHFGAAVSIPAGGGTISNLQFRLRKTDVTGLVTTTLGIADVSAAVVGLNFPFERSTIVSLDTLDYLFLELQNTTEDQNIIVNSAWIVFTQ